MNYYHATEKKPEHGGGWAFMQHNRREGSRIICACGAGGWTGPGHPDAAAAEQCFYEHEKARGVREVTYGQATRCVICGEWTPYAVEAVSQLITPSEYVCREHFDSEEEAAAWLWRRYQFSPGIVIMASW